MKKTSTLFLKFVIIIVGLLVLSLCVFCTYMLVSDGGNWKLTMPVLAIINLSSLAFFTALYQAFKLLIYIDNSNVFTELSIQALKKIKYCGMAIGSIYIAGMPVLVYIAEIDDAPGVAGLGLIFIAASVVVATFAAVLQKLVQTGIEMKSENDLTI